MVILIVSCRTVKNGYFKMPVNRYDINAIKKERIKDLLHTDTVIILELSCSGMCSRGTENDIFIFTKKSEQTQIERISNHRKYKTFYLTDSSIKWNNIIVNIQSYIDDKIIDYEEVVENNKTYRVFQSSDGKTQSLDICYDNIKHRVYLGPLVDTFNKNNINLKLIKELRELVYRISWVPSEKIKFKMTR